MIKIFQRKSSNDYEKKSYSQTGEDIIIDYWLSKKDGFYVDIGANHPILLNNTYLFYKKGWRGINVEPNPEIIGDLNRLRPNDINLNIGISGENTKKDFYTFDPSTLSTFSSINSSQFQANGYKLLDTKKIECITLKRLFNKYTPNSATLDILNIDVEGTENTVLTSNDWANYRPKFVIVETVNHKPTYKINKNYDRLMEKYSYCKFADTYINTIYISQEYMQYINIKL